MGKAAASNFARQASSSITVSSVCSLEIDYLLIGLRSSSHLTFNPPARGTRICAPPVRRKMCKWCTSDKPDLMPPENRKQTATSPRILIVDDDAGQRSLLDSFLRSQGFQTMPVASGEMALEVLRTEQFNMMISDVRMPGLSGLETLRRARKENTVLPVLLVTAYADIREAVGAMRDGAVNYLAKPIDLDELLVTVQQATGIAKTTPLKFSADRQLPENVVAKDRKSTRLN